MYKKVFCHNDICFTFKPLGFTFGSIQGICDNVKLWESNHKKLLTNGQFPKWLSPHGQASYRSVGRLDGESAKRQELIGSILNQSCL